MSYLEWGKISGADKGDSDESWNDAPIDQFRRQTGSRDLPGRTVPDGNVGGAGLRFGVGPRPSFYRLRDVARSDATVVIRGGPHEASATGHGGDRAAVA